jgi:uncharacterized membrane protein YedE/YeeE
VTHRPWEAPGSLLGWPEFVGAQTIARFISHIASRTPCSKRPRCSRDPAPSGVSFAVVRLRCPVAPMPAPVAAIPRQVQLKLTLCASVVIVAVCLAIRASSSSVHALLFLTGVALGVVLCRSIFGFKSAFRVLLAERRSAGFRAQMIMLGSACLFFFPALASGSLWGRQVVGFVSPVGVSVAVGAFLFGIGMQLGGGCASGTLYALGGGSTRMLATLAFFVVGSVLGITQLAWWSRLPSLGPISMIATFG